MSSLLLKLKKESDVFWASSVCAKGGACMWISPYNTDGCLVWNFIGHWCFCLLTLSLEFYGHTCFCFQTRCGFVRKQNNRHMRRPPAAIPDRRPPTAGRRPPAAGRRLPGAGRRALAQGKALKQMVARDTYSRLSITKTAVASPHDQPWI